MSYYQHGPPQPQGGALGGAPPLPPGWTSQWSPEHQRPYYIDQSTGRSQWEPPAMPAPSPAPPPPMMSSPAPQMPQQQQQPMPSPGDAQRAMGGPSPGYGQPQQQQAPMASGGGGPPGPAPPMPAGWTAFWDSNVRR
ncbi:hypothetical protein LOY91_006898, partial [Ophidiomyces ophidiicola]